ncbi:uncharacterized protein MONBRDRAFT_26368 [Monosiga brevicollis MX1]|uniref:Uncharacterized protein n=1 Tax=Monosiga brevicollis TaxID=81824 RepID=A9V261_MONBE|nr:uncharacterized protein MONBRDRAFT_26368 [Monosiga brevicollis MX1]EDQ88198.1 predicted protein [Monosiga brevicollis MX1]|eukprot:XP_001746791.1 hypothetical protein [Monosiga brevicollis MX1]
MVGDPLRQRHWPGSAGTALLLLLLLLLRASLRAGAGEAEPLAESYIVADDEGHLRLPEQVYVNDMDLTAELILLQANTTRYGQELDPYRHLSIHGTVVQGFHIVWSRTFFPLSASLSDGTTALEFDATITLGNPSGRFYVAIDCWAGERQITNRMAFRIPKTAAVVTQASSDTLLLDLSATGNPSAWSLSLDSMVYIGFYYNATGLPFEVLGAPLLGQELRPEGSELWLNVSVPPAVVAAVTSQNGPVTAFVHSLGPSFVYPIGWFYPGFGERTKTMTSQVSRIVDPSRWNAFRLGTTRFRIGFIFNYPIDGDTSDPNTRITQLQDFRVREVLLDAP